MNVLYLTTHLNYGGISSYVVSLAKGITRRGHRAFVASAGGTYEAGLACHGITPVRVPVKTKCELNPLLGIATAALARVVRSSNIDIIHAQTRVGQVVAAAVSRLTKTPFVSTCHGFFRRNIGRQMFPCWGEKVIAVSPEVRKHLLIDFYVPEKRVVHIPTGIDVNRFRVAASRLDPLATDRTLGIIARLSPVKGHRFLLEAMPIVLREFADARLFIFGEGPAKQQLIRLADRVGISDRVFFLPAVAHTDEVMQDIDIFVLPSLQEGLGLSLLEAQSCGLPVIAANVGGIPNVVQHNVSGLLVPPGDAEALAAAIMKLMQDRRLAVRLGKRARQDVEEKFNLQQMVERVLEVYGAVAHGKGNPA